MEMGPGGARQGDDEDGNEEWETNKAKSTLDSGCRAGMTRREWGERKTRLPRFARNDNAELSAPSSQLSAVSIRLDIV